MQFEKSSSGIYVPAIASEPLSNSGQVEPPPRINKSWVRRLLRDFKDYFLVAIQIATAVILYLNYQHTVVPTEQKERLAEQVATLQGQSQQATRDVAEKMNKLRSLESEVAQSNIQLMQLRSKGAELSREIASSQLQASRADLEAVAATARLKQSTAALEQAQWSIFRQSVSFEQMRPGINFRKGNNNYTGLEDAMSAEDPIAYLIAKYKQSWPDLGVLSAQVTKSIRAMRSPSFPTWMSDQFADVYAAEAKAIQCDVPDFDALRATYSAQMSKVEGRAQAKAKVEDAREIAEAEKLNKGVTYTENPANHRGFLVRADVEGAVSVVSDLRSLLNGRAQGCIDSLSTVGDDFLEKKGTPQTIPADLLD